MPENVGLQNESKIPKRPVLNPDDPQTKLQRGVKAALNALPGEFEFEHSVSGVAATDLVLILSSGPASNLKSLEH